MTPAASAGAADFLAVDGEMGALVRAYDWAGTSLGPIEAWPQSLKTTVAILLRSPVPIVLLWGPDGVMIYNDAYSGFAEGRHPRLLGSKVREGWPEVADFNDTVMKAGLAGGTLSYRDQELTLYRKGAPEPVWMNLDYSPVLDESGRPAGVLAIVVETTDRVLAERRIAAEGERLRALFEQAPGFMAVLRGPDHMFEIVNDSYLQLVGHRRNLVGKPAREALPEIEGQGFFELLDNVFATGEPFVGHGMAVKLQRRPDGPGEERFVDFVYQPITDSTGTVTGIFAEGYDVTERIRGTAALRESEERFRQALQIGTVGVLFFRLDGEIVDANDAFLRMTGYSRADMEAGLMRWDLMTPPEYMPASRRRIEELRSTGLSTPYEQEYIRKDGSRIWFLFAARMLGPDEAVEYALDMTERKRAEEHQRLLVHELNHRVKNTLATVQAIAGQAFKGSEHDETRDVFVARLFALARAHDILTHENWQGAALEDLVLEAVAPYRRDDGGRFEIEGPALWLNPRMALALSMALHELATNAAKYGALSVPSGRVAITWTVTPGDPARLVFRWQEEGGPPVSPPTRKGFGTRLIERSLALELAGEVRIAYETGGVVCVVTAALDESAGAEPRFRVA